VLLLADEVSLSQPRLNLIVDLGRLM